MGYKPVDDPNKGRVTTAKQKVCQWCRGRGGSHTDLRCPSLAEEARRAQRISGRR